jgi:protein-S-isoprenylcysteine O-methyltransferase Ste14
VEIRDEHEFVREGPFRWVRHPAYLSMILELVAGGLILNAYWALGVAGLIFVPTLAWRLKLEEAALVEKFGEAYLQYRRCTPALLPLKWPRLP